MKICFGTHRLNFEDKQSSKLIELALNRGCTTIVNSSLINYDKYDEIIGSLLSSNKNLKPVIISKGGILTKGEKSEYLKTLKGNDKDACFPLKKNPLFSLDESVLEFQIENSLKRLKKETLDVFIIQYPEEYLISDLHTKDSFYDSIEHLITFLEKQVKTKKIKEYGFSSSSFSIEETDKINLDKVINLSKKGRKEIHLKWIGFPLNLVEREALEKGKGGTSLLDFAKKNNLNTLSFRPLSAFSADKFLRLATYEEISKGFNYSESQRILEDFIDLLEFEILDKFGQITMNDYAFFTFLRRNWVELHDFDQLDYIFNDAIPIFISKIKDNKVINEKVDTLHRVGSVQIRFDMTKRGNEFRKKAIKEGIIPDNPEKELATLAFETYKKWKIDFVSLNFREIGDIQKLTKFF
ncbi:MAG: hypothetical protein CME68_09035 [Halobacteriovoraceae bacterium]|nr:hypothetical protein [Halobacteriovoraceae bacterium]